MSSHRFGAPARLGSALAPLAVLAALALGTPAHADRAEAPELDRELADAGLLFDPIPRPDGTGFAWSDPYPDSTARLSSPRARSTKRSRRRRGTILRYETALAVAGREVKMKVKLPGKRRSVVHFELKF